MPCSAQVTLPATALPSTVTWNAAAVAGRSIRSVNRTEIVAPRSMSVVALRGRNRTTEGALTVLTVSAGETVNATPSVSASPANQTRYSLLGARSD